MKIIRNFPGFPIFPKIPGFPVFLTFHTKLSAFFLTFVV